MSAKHRLLESPSLGRRVHLWSFGEVGQPVIVFPSNAGVAHEWRESGMIDALSPLLKAGKIKIYCPETNVSKSFSGTGSMTQRMAHHAAYESFVMGTLVPFIREDCRMPRVRMVATGCSVGALYSSIFVLKHPEIFAQALCLSGRYRTSRFFDGNSNHDVYMNDPLAFVRTCAARRSTASAGTRTSRSSSGAARTRRAASRRPASSARCSSESTSRITSRSGAARAATRTRGGRSRRSTTSVRSSE